MNKVKLSEVATVELSSIDKKIDQNEIPVKLCNFTDVYYNWAITEDIISSCMNGSVKETELNKFILKKGQVAITKDSETRDDIGMPCYISNSFDNAVLGYHCALITPDNKKLNGKYLNALLNTEYARKSFENQASGSGQRYTLSKEAIESIQIPLPSLDEQKRIGSFFSNIDKKIQNNKSQIEILESIAKTIYDYWFVQFDFPNEDGKPYKSSGGKMVWNEALKREIPEGWSVNSLSDYIKIIRGVSYSPLEELSSSRNKTINLLKSNNIENGRINFEAPIILPKEKANSDQWLTKGSVFITMSSGSKLHMGKTAIVYRNLPYVFGAFCSKIEINSNFKALISSYFISDEFRTYIENVCAGTSINNIKNQYLLDIKIPFPPQPILRKYEVIFEELSQKIASAEKEKIEEDSLRKFLLPLLMNGQVTLQ